ncbi:T6SS effector BTH_I2691 family protein [Achromobacter sp. UBA2119]|uniref:T6SS effector BTH_I2691 family protein n=1 Tax=Achromobacter sp. UBA2119 TaxID=1945911 RepID=UPI00257F8A08|nr:T6SS effector BTH_I2691 family protein [Achromobacter sp. UBA2119]
MSKSTAGGATSAPACCPRIPILPIRYAIVPNADGAPLYRYAESGFKLEATFQRLQLSSYTLRALRPGYVYVFMKGPKGESLVIHEHDGEGHYQKLTYTGLEDYDKKNKYKTGARMGWVWADTSPDTAKEVWIGYSTHLWTNAMTARITKDPEARQLHMRALDMVELTSGVKSPSGQAHLLPANTLTEWVEDFKPREQRLPLKWSCHASENELSVATFIAQGSHYRFTQPRVPAVVALNDAEGISLDLGLIAAAYQHQITDLKRRPDQRAEGASPHHLPDCLSLDVDQIHLASSEFHHKNLTAFLLTESLKSMFRASGQDAAKIASARHEWHRNQRTNRPIPSLEQLEYEVLTDERISPSGARLAKTIDTALYFDFLRQRKEADAQLKVMMHELNKACADHDCWLSTAESINMSDPRSLAAAFSAFDRDNRQSAAALELSITLMMRSMTQSLSFSDDGDARYERLEKWCDDPGSPLYVSLAAYNPFKEKADAVGTILGAADSIISELALKFPAIKGVTDLTAQTVTTVVLKRLKGKTRWDASRNLREQVHAAAREANMEKILGLLAGRYDTTKTTTAGSLVSQDVDDFLKKGMEEVNRTSRIKVEGNRTVVIERTQTVTAKPTLRSLSATATGAGFNIGMVYFNIINLGYALKTLEREYSHGNATNFASAILGVIGSLSVAVLGTRTTYIALMARMGYRIPGLGFSIALNSFISSKLYGRLIVGPGIFLGLITDIQKGHQLKKGGNQIAANYTYAGGISVAMGTGAIAKSSAIASAIYAATSTAGASAPVPVLGWIAAAVILTGTALIVGGMWLHSRAAAQAFSPMELWAARCQFGNLKNDGKERSGIPLDGDRRLPRYKELISETKDWYQASFAPILLDSDQAESIGLEGMESEWRDRWFAEDEVEFVVLLPGFIQGQSTWKGALVSNTHGEINGPTSSIGRPKITVHSQKPECIETAAGLVLRHHVKGEKFDGMFMTVDYKPNQGLDETAVVGASFSLSD